jgi:hypothetical protein
MDIADLHNLTILARKGMATIAESMPSEHAQAAWKAIGAAEAELAKFKKAQEEQSVEVQEVVTDTEEVVTDTEEVDPE